MKGRGRRIITKLEERDREEEARGQKAAGKER